MIKRFKVIFKDIVLNEIASSKLLLKEIRYMVYKSYGMNIFTKHISPDCFFGSSNIVIKKGSFINYGCFFDTQSLIEIGENCSLGMQVTLCTSTHELGNKNSRAGKSYGKSIVIGDGSWIGARTTILSGVNIGEGCIIGAGSVVTKDCEPNSLYVGNPARKIRSLE